MPEVVEADRPQLRALQQRFEGAVTQIGGVDDRARLRCEDEPARLVERTHLLHLLELAGEVIFERLHRASGEPDGAAALVRLRFPEDERLALVGESAPHAQHASLKIYVVPLEG